MDALGRLGRTVSEDLDLLGSTVTLMPGVGVLRSRARSTRQRLVDVAQEVLAMLETRP